MLTPADTTPATGAHDALADDELTARQFAALNHLETVTDGVVSRLTCLNDEQVMDARAYAVSLGRAAWRVECACDAELLRRLRERTQVLVGRGRTDDAGTGIVAQIDRVAAQMGVARRTVQNNATIYETFLTDDALASSCAVLEDKQFYTEALRAPDKAQALVHLAGRKAENPFFTTRDARLEVEALRDSMPPMPQTRAQQNTAGDWRREVERHLCAVMTLVPEVCHAFRALVDKAKQDVWKLPPTQGGGQ